MCLMIETLLSYRAEWRSSYLLRQSFRPEGDFLPEWHFSTRGRFFYLREHFPPGILGGHEGLSGSVGSRFDESKWLLSVGYWALCACPGYTQCFDRTLVYLCTSPLQNLAVPQDFYSPLSISLERFGWPCIWWCGIGGFQEQVQCLFVGLVVLLFCLQLFFLSLLFLYRLVVWGWGLRTNRVSISLSRPCIANLF